MRREEPTFGQQIDRCSIDPIEWDFLSKSNIEVASSIDLRRSQPRKSERIVDERVNRRKDRQVLELDRGMGDGWDEGPAKKVGMLEVEDCRLVRRGRKRLRLHQAAHLAGDDHAEEAGWHRRAGSRTATRIRYPGVRSDE